MDNKPKVLTWQENNEIAAMHEVQEMWGAQNADEMAGILQDSAYAVKFSFISGGPGYVGDYFIIQGDAVGEPPIQIIRVDGVLKLL
jgi:hypothetical protein